MIVKLPNFGGIKNNATVWQFGGTLPKTNSKFALENRARPQKEAGSYSKHPFSGANC